MKTTKYFDGLTKRPDRTIIKMEWIIRTIEKPVKKVIQSDGRIRLWSPIKEMDSRYLKVILLEDGETIHNAFFDRGFKL